MYHLPAFNPNLPYVTVRTNVGIQYCNVDNMGNPISLPGGQQHSMPGHHAPTAQYQRPMPATAQPNLYSQPYMAGHYNPQPQSTMGHGNPQSNEPCSYAELLLHNSSDTHTPPPPPEQPNVAAPVDSKGMYGKDIGNIRLRNGDYLTLVRGCNVIPAVNQVAGKVAFKANSADFKLVNARKADKLYQLLIIGEENIMNIEEHLGGVAVPATNVISDVSDVTTDFRIRNESCINYTVQEDRLEGGTYSRAVTSMSAFNPENSIWFFLEDIDIMVLKQDNPELEMLNDAVQQATYGRDPVEWIKAVTKMVHACESKTSASYLPELAKMVRKTFTEFLNTAIGLTVEGPLRGAHIDDGIGDWDSLIQHPAMEAYTPALMDYIRCEMHNIATFSVFIATVGENDANIVCSNKVHCLVDFKGHGDTYTTGAITMELTEEVAIAARSAFDALDRSQDIVGKAIPWDTSDNATVPTVSTIELITSSQVLTVVRKPGVRGSERMCIINVTDRY